MERTPIQSKMIASIGYNKTTQTLEIEFTPKTKKDGTVIPGSIWQYAPVPAEVVKALGNAKSRGRYFGMNIRTQYPAIKIFPRPYPLEPDEICESDIRSKSPYSMRPEESTHEESSSKEEAPSKEAVEDRNR
jgi:hypothetical protein